MAEKLAFKVKLMVSDAPPQGSISVQKLVDAYLSGLSADATRLAVSLSESIAQTLKRNLERGVSTRVMLKRALPMRFSEVGFKSEHPLLSTYQQADEALLDQIYSQFEMMRPLIYASNSGQMIAFLAQIESLPALTSVVSSCPPGEQEALAQIISRGVDGLRVQLESQFLTGVKLKLPDVQFDPKEQVVFIPKA